MSAQLGHYWQQHKIGICFVVIFLCACLVAALGIGVVQSRIDMLRLSGSDSVSFAQVLQNALSGKGMVSTIAPPFIEQHWFGIHFSPIFYLVLPIYALFPDLLTLNILHSGLTAGAGVLLYFLLLRMTKHPLYALAGSLLYVFSPFVLNASAWDFHETAFAPMAMVLLLWAIVEKRLGLFIFACLLLICIKEHYGLAVAAAGVLWWREHKEPKRGVITIAMGITVLVLVVGFIMPHFSPSDAPVMLDSGSSIDRFSWMFNPSRWPSVFEKLFFSGVLYVALLLLPFICLPLRNSWWLLPAVADVATALLSTNGLMRHPHAYHAAPIIPVLIVASYHYIQCNPGALSIGRWARASLLVTVMFSAVLLPYPISKFHDLWEIGHLRWSAGDKIKGAIADINKLIPADEPIAMQTNLMAYFPSSRPIYEFPPGKTKANWVVQHLDFQFKHKLHIVNMPFNAHISDMAKETNALVHDLLWQPVYIKNRIVVWRNYTDGSHLADRKLLKVGGLQRNMVKKYCAVARKKPKVSEEICK